MASGSTVTPYTNEPVATNGPSPVMGATDYPTLPVNFTGSPSDPYNYSSYGPNPGSVYSKFPNGLPPNWSWDEFRKANQTTYNPDGYSDSGDRMRQWITAGRPGWDVSGRPLGNAGELNLMPTGSMFGPNHDIPNPAARGPTGTGIPGVVPGQPTTTTGTNGNPAARVPGGGTGITPNFPTGSPIFGPNPTLPSDPNDPANNPNGINPNDLMNQSKSYYSANANAATYSLNGASRSMGNTAGRGSPFSLGSFARAAPRPYQGY